LAGRFFKHGHGNCFNLEKGFGNSLGTKIKVGIGKGIILKKKAIWARFLVKNLKAIGLLKPRLETRRLLKSGFKLWATTFWACVLKRIGHF